MARSAGQPTIPRFLGGTEDGSTGFPWPQKHGVGAGGIKGCCIDGRHEERWSNASAQEKGRGVTLVWRANPLATSETSCWGRVSRTGLFSQLTGETSSLSLLLPTPKAPEELAPRRGKWGRVWEHVTLPSPARRWHRGPYSALGAEMTALKWTVLKSGVNTDKCTNPKRTAGWILTKWTQAAARSQGQETAYYQHGPHQALS